MSISVASETTDLGQFASNAGYTDLIKNANGAALNDLLDKGYSEHVPQVINDLHNLMLSCQDKTVCSTAKSLEQLIKGQEIVIIHDGTSNGDQQDDAAAIDSVRKLFAGGPGSGRHKGFGSLDKFRQQGPPRPTTPDGRKMVDDYIKMVAPMSATAKLLQDNGQHFEHSGEEVNAGHVKECYKNAFQLASSNPEKYAYAEGMAVPHGIPLPIDHAWVVDKATNKVVDPTWKDGAAAYFGVKFKPEYAMKVAARSGVYGILSYTNPAIFQGKDKVEDWKASALLAGGPGSGCHGPNCGRPKGTVILKNSLRIPRSEMPQITKADLQDYIFWLKHQGIKSHEETVDPNSLKPIQKTVNDNVAKALPDVNIPGRPMLISQDSYILDGHHRFWRALLDGKSLNVLRINIPMSKLLEITHKYPNVEYHSPQETAHKWDKKIAAEGLL